MKGSLFLAALVVSAAVWADEGEGLVERESRNPWRLTIGTILSPRVRTKMNAPRLTPPALPANGSLRPGSVRPTIADPSAGYVDREYADGYVNKDAGVNPSQNDHPGYTWNWGADDVSNQYSTDSNGQMVFQSASWTEVHSSSSSWGGSGEYNDRELFVGVEVMGGWTFYEDQTFDAAIDTGFRFYGCDCIEAESKYDATVTTRDYYIEDRYDASHWGTPNWGPDIFAGQIPGDKYDGPAYGLDEGRYGPLIGATPERDDHKYVDGSEAVQLYNYYSHAKLNYRIWDLRLGPTFGWKATERLTIRGGTYLLIGLVDASLKATSYSPEGATRRKASTCGGVFGAAFGVSAQYNVTENLFLMAGVEYDLWARDVVLNAGGSSAEIKLSDMSITLGLGFEF